MVKVQQVDYCNICKRKHICPSLNRGRRMACKDFEKAKKGKQVGGLYGRNSEAYDI